MKQDTQEQTIKCLKSLAQYEIDCSFIIQQAMDSVSDDNFRSKIAKIKQECDENIKELSDMITKYGADAPEFSRDFKGFFMQGYVGMRGLISDGGVMKALKTNTKMLLDAFSKALDSDIELEAKELVQNIYDNAKEHLEYIEKSYENA